MRGRPDKLIDCQKKILVSEASKALQFEKVCNVQLHLQKRIFKFFDKFTEIQENFRFNWVKEVMVLEVIWSFVIILK